MISNPLEKKINEYLQIPGTDRTDEQNAFLLFTDIVKQYEGIKSPKDITKEIEEHYYSIKNKELTAEHREIFNLPIETRLKDYQNPCKPGKHHWREKGEAIDRFCEVLNIKKKINFHEQIKQAEIYEEDVLASDWYRYVIQYKWELNEIFQLEIGRDFEDSPLQYFKKFCLKVMGISCTLTKPQSMNPDTLKSFYEPLFKQHKKEDIYRKHYKEVFPKPKYPPTKMRKCSDDWIDKKIEKGEELTIAEKKFRALRRHVAIHRQQPQYKRYLSNIEDSPLLNLRNSDEFKNNKHNGRTSR